MSNAWQNVTVERESDGTYLVTGRTGRFKARFHPRVWRDFGLKAIRKGDEGVCDWRISGLRRKAKRKG